MKLSLEIDQMKIAFKAEQKSLVDKNSKLAWEIEKMDIAVEAERKKFALELEAERKKFALEFDTERKRVDDNERQSKHELRLKSLENRFKDFEWVQNSKNDT